MCHASFLEKHQSVCSVCLPLSCTGFLLRGSDSPTKLVNSEGSNWLPSHFRSHFVHVWRSCPTYLDNNWGSSSKAGHWQNAIVFVASLLVRHYCHLPLGYRAMLLLSITRGQTVTCCTLLCLARHSASGSGADSRGSSIIPIFAVGIYAVRVESKSIGEGCKCCRI